MEKSQKAEIYRCHLGKTVLKLKRMGVQNVEEFMARDLYEAPDKSAVKVAISSLIDLAAISPPAAISEDIESEAAASAPPPKKRLPSPDLLPFGKVMFELPLDPAMCKLVLSDPSHAPQSASGFVSCEEMVAMVSMLTATKNVRFVFIYF
jgi:HrpA-like RNA helicase